MRDLSRKDEATQAAHLQSSNLSHFAAIVHAVTHLPHVTDVMRPFTSPDRRESLVVDVVADQGRSWVKVIARKGQALHLVWAGQGQYGERDMEQQLQEYAECAERHPVNFHPPRVHATFYNTLTFPMARVLQGQGVTVWGKVVAVDSGVLHKLLAIHDDVEAEDDDEDECLEDFSDVDDSGSVDHGAGTHFCSILAHKVSTKQEEKEETKAVDEIESDNCVDIGSPGGANPTDDQDMHVSCSGLEVRATSLDVGNSLWFRDTVGTSGCDFDVNCREDDDCKNMTDINVSDRLHENSCDHRVSHVSGRPHNDSPVEKAADVLSEVGKQGREYTNSMRSAPVCAACALSHEPRTPSHRLTPHDFKSEDQDTQDLETDSADPNEGIHDSAFNEEARTTTHRETTSWTLSSRSHHCLSRILASYPDYRDLFMLPTFSVSEKSSVGIGRRRGGEGEREKVNLDITTLITLVSSVCHGGCHFRFKDKVLDQQAAEEREHPSLPDLQQYLQ
ncbi:uncharacterized protein, partial [Littorina saxatilis]|uniref:uncharacterized protein n=1 Tax=Littorina saxatilis TaxID=31220 RepID=UPI0038B4EAB4